jgi:hypothetical protein
MHLGRIRGHVAWHVERDLQWQLVTVEESSCEEVEMIWKKLKVSCMRRRYLPTMD